MKKIIELVNDFLSHIDLIDYLIENKDSNI